MIHIRSDAGQVIKHMLNTMHSKLDLVLKFSPKVLVITNKISGEITIRPNNNHPLHGKNRSKFKVLLPWYRVRHVDYTVLCERHVY